MRRFGRLPRAVAVLFAIVALCGPAAVAGAQPVPEDAAPQGCSTAPAEVTRDIGGQPYLVRVPGGLTGPAPLLVALHGGGSNPARHETQSGWTAFAAQQKFIVAYPRGGKDDIGDPQRPDDRSWYFENGDRRDVDFLLRVIAEIKSTWCVDGKRVHMAGHSNGGQMTSRMACAASAQLGAVAMYAGGSHGGCEDGVPVRKLSFGFFTADNDFTQAPVFAAHLQWRGTIGCGNDAAVETGPEIAEGFRYSCEQGANVVWRKYRAGGHEWPAGARGADVRDRMWQLFRNHPLP
ncbi:alpha/beta hydrolase family esterase [Nocardia wallacei]|uniref:alpha/beta hydrolase family esterase n=1 Tax=Nocardia wallacei TaxID=480035 RepID=UPI00245821B5|nr:PHB depolymerase family esterase [Nocardia wallacei]